MAEDADKNKNITRRSLLGLGAGAFVYQLLGPCAKAWAEPDNPWGGWCVHRTDCLGSGRLSDSIALDTAFENNWQTLTGGGNAGSSASARACPFIWDFSVYGTDGPVKGGTARLGAGIKCEVKCAYSNALFAYVESRPLVQAYSYAPYRGGTYIGWHNTQADNSYRLAVSVDDKKLDVQGDTACVFNLDTGYDSDAGHYNNADPDTGTNGIYFANWYQGNDGYNWYERYSDYERWAATETIAFPVRRGYDARTVKFQAAADYWNYFCNVDGHVPTNERDDDPYDPNDPNYHRYGKGFGVYMRDALYQKLQGTKELGLCTANSGYPSHCGIEWAGRIVSICDGYNQDQSLMIGDGFRPVVDGTELPLASYPKGSDWPDATSRLNRSWYVHLSYLGTTDPANWVVNDLYRKWLGTLCIVNAMQLTRADGVAARLDQDGGLAVPEYEVKAQTWTANDGWANQAFWIHTHNDLQYIISDASGLMLNRKEWDGVQWVCSFHTNGEGLDRDLTHASHAWKLKDVFFKLRSGDALNIGSAEVEPGASIAMNNIESNTYPHVGEGSTNLRYEYMWVRMNASEDDSYLTKNKEIRIEGRAHLESYGDTVYWKPANNMLGAIHVKSLEAVQLRIAGNSRGFGGGIAYRLCYDNGVNGKNEDWGESNGCWGGWLYDGGIASGAGRRNHSLQAYLYGEISRYYTLRYRTGNSLGWSHWRREGQICIAPQRDGSGNVIACPWIDAIAIEIVPRAEVLDSPAYNKGSLPPATDAGTEGSAPFSSGNMSRKVTVDDLNKKLVGVARAVLPSEAYDEPRYLGYVRTMAVKPIKKVNIHFIADGEQKWVKWRWPLGTTYNIPQDAVEACTRPTSTYLDKWYYDSGYTNPLSGDSFTPNDVNVEDYYIYCRNQYTLEFKWADETRSFFGAHEPYAETGLNTRLYESTAQGPQMVPETIYRWHGNTLGSLTWHYTTAYVERSDAGGYMTTNAIKSVFASKTATDSSDPVKASAKITGSATLYVVWKRPTYDGFDSN